MVFNAPFMAISSMQPNSPHSINETLGLLHSISTQRDTSFGGRSDLTYNSWITLDHLYLVLFLSYQLLPETLRLFLLAKGSHLTLGFHTPS